MAVRANGRTDRGTMVRSCGKPPGHVADTTIRTAPICSPDPRLVTAVLAAYFGGRARAPHAIRTRCRRDRTRSIRRHVHRRLVVSGAARMVGASALVHADRADAEPL